MVQSMRGASLGHTVQSPLQSRSPGSHFQSHALFIEWAHRMIDIRKLKELLKLMAEYNLTELDLRDEKDGTVTLKRGLPQSSLSCAPALSPAAAPVATLAPPAGAPAQASPAKADPANDNSGLVTIESPMVGTYYSSPNPDADPYISIGASIGTDSVVCLIEAMKVFNEIKAETTGTIEKILVNNGDAVEFGQKLFMIKPN